MQIKERQREGIRILDLEGSLVAGEPCQQLREHSTADLASKPQVVVNLAEVDYIDSSGLGMLVNCFSTLERNGGGLRILSPSERDMELMVLTKLATVFQVFNDEQESVNSFFPDRVIQRFDILSFVQQQRKAKESK